MKPQQNLTQIAIGHLHPRREIRFWQAYRGALCIDENNSIAILRAKYKGMPNITFKSVR